MYCTSDRCMGTFGSARITLCCTSPTTLSSIEFLPWDFDFYLGDRKTRSSVMMFFFFPYTKHIGLSANCQVWSQGTKGFLHSENLIFIEVETFPGSVKFAWVRILTCRNSIRTALWLLLWVFLHMHAVRTSNVS